MHDALPVPDLVLIRTAASVVAPLVLSAVLTSMLGYRARIWWQDRQREARLTRFEARLSQESQA